MDGFMEMLLPGCSTLEDLLNWTKESDIPMDAPLLVVKRGEGNTEFGIAKIADTVFYEPSSGAVWFCVDEID